MVGPTFGCRLGIGVGPRHLKIGAMTHHALQYPKVGLPCAGHLLGP